LTWIQLLQNPFARRSTILKTTTTKKGNIGGYERIKPSICKHSVSTLQLSLWSRMVRPQPACHSLAWTISFLGTLFRDSQPVDDIVNIRYSFSSVRPNATCNTNVNCHLQHSVRISSKLWSIDWSVVEISEILNRNQRTL
jgi:hypothetical protein